MLARRNAALEQLLALRNDAAAQNAKAEAAAQAAQTQQASTDTVEALKADVLRSQMLW